MKAWAALLMLMAGGAAVSAPALRDRAAMSGVPNVARAHQNWMLKCQGCHRPDATGTPATTPPMKGKVAMFMHTDGGREYLGRVPGVATAGLPDDQLAELVNWTLQYFDPAHVPKDFKPYTAKEIGQLRSRPLRTDAATVRGGLMAKIDASKSIGPEDSPRIGVQN